MSRYSRLALDYLDHLALAWARHDELEAAALIIGGADSAWGASEGARAPLEQRVADQARSLLEERIGSDALDARRAAASKLTWEELVSIAIGR